MIEKEYYRLEELKKRFHLTENDVRYLVEKKLVKACFSIRKTKFVVDGWDGDSRIGYAHINYQGLIALPDAEVDSLIANGKITPLNYLLSLGGAIQLVETDYPLGMARPKTFEEAWKPKYACHRNAEFMEARLSPFVSKTFWHSYETAKKEVNYSRELFPKAKAWLSFQVVFGARTYICRIAPSMGYDRDKFDGKGQGLKCI